MQSETILYAEDDENDAFFMQRAFQRLGARDRLKIVTNGRMATEYLAKEKPSLVLLDIKMPEMSGLEVLNWVRQQSHLQNLCVVMLTSSTQERDIEFCKKHGANGYLVKPSRSEQLAELVRRTMEAANQGAQGRLNLDGNLLP